MPTAEDVERPTCECHGEPMTRNGHRPDGKQRWLCPDERRRRSHDDYWLKGGKERLAALYRDRAERGVCRRCEGPLLTDALCWNCLNEMEARDAIRL